MTLGVVLAPELPLAALFAIGLLALLAYAVQRGLLTVWIYTLGYALRRLADILDFRILGKAVELGGPVRRVEAAIFNHMQRACRRTEQLVGYCFHGVARILEWQAKQLAGLAHDVLHWGQSLVHVTVPRLTKAMIIAAFPLPWLARRVAAIVAAHLPHIGRLGRVKWRGLTRKQIAAMIAAAAGTIVTTLPGKTVYQRIREAAKPYGLTKKQIRRLERLLTATGAAALVATAFTRMGLQWLRCARWRKVGPAVCRMDLGLLNFLLGTATAVFALSHLCELVAYIQRATALALPSILALVNETEGYVCGGRKSLPSGVVQSDGKRVAAFPTGVPHS